jgi:hypothetical protein
MGKDTHALSEPAQRTALEVLAANDVEVIIQRGAGVTPTPVISWAILTYVEALRSGDADLARFIFERMLGYANHLGLYSEELGPRGEHLGNFPQAFSHLALISASYRLAATWTPRSDRAEDPGMGLTISRSHTRSVGYASDEVALDAAPPGRLAWSHEPADFGVSGNAGAAKRYCSWRSHLVAAIPAATT